MTSAAPNENERAHAARFYGLFRGADHHGTYKPEPTPVKPGEKISIRSTARMVYEPPTPDLWRLHLDGTRPLGICPLRSDDSCLFGAIDLDDRDTKHSELVARVRQKGLPLVVCRSKSGGAHLYVFLSEPMPAAALQRRLREFSDLLGFPAKTEIFPKQTRTAEIDKAGGWLNAPYFQGDETTRYAVKENGLAMSLPEFLDMAEGFALTPAQLVALEVPPDRPTSARPPGADLTPDEFEKMLARWLRELAEAPHGTRDDKLMRVARDVGRCSGVIAIDKPAAEWRARGVWRELGKSDQEFDEQWKHNVEWGEKEGNPPRLPDGDGGDDRYPTIEKIVVLTGGEEELWRVTVANHGDITLPVKEVTNYYTFNLRCAEKLRKYFRHMKVDAWNDRIDAALVRAEFEAIPPDETVDGMMREQLRAFCMDKYRGDRIDELLLGKPIHVEDEDRIYFRFEDFEKFLRTGSSRFKNETRQRLGVLIREAVGKDNYRQTMKVVMGHPKGMPVRWIRRSVFGQSVDLPLPPIEPPPL